MIEKKFLGIFEDKEVSAFSITNNKGMSVCIINYGGAIKNIFVPDKNNRLGDVVAGFKNLPGYLQQDNPFFGALIGRYANRICGGAFTIGNKKYSLSANENNNTLHGGLKGFDKVYWRIKPAHQKNSLLLNYLSKDGEEGFPGNLEVTVVYHLSDNNELSIEYKANCDQPTAVCLTNHCYFNLSAGDDDTILNHLLRINAKAYTPVNEQMVPVGSITDVEGTALDFRNFKKIGAEIEKVNGYDHNLILEKQKDELKKAALLYHAASGRFMEMLTTEPALQFYTGNHLQSTLNDTKKV